MKRSIWFYLMTASFAATLFIGAFSFLPVTVQADKADAAAKEAEAAMKEAEALAEKCKELQDAAQKAEDDAKKAEDDAKEAKKAADDEMPKAGAKKTAADEAADAAAEAADAAGDAADDAWDKSEKGAADKEKKAGQKEAASDKADKTAAKEDEKIPDGLVQAKKQDAREKRKAARAARRKARKARRDANQKCDEAKAAFANAKKLIALADSELLAKTTRGGKDDSGVGDRVKGLKKRLKNLEDAGGSGDDTKQKTVNPPGPEQTTTKTDNGLQKATFDTSAGRVTVNLPDDLTARDTISGTVVAEPKGKTDEERARNQAELNGYVIDFEGTKLPVSRPSFVWIAPPSQASSSARYHLRLFDVDGKDLPTVLVEVRIVETTEPGRIIGGEWYPPSRQTHPDFLWWPVGQQGRPKEIYGPFDGYFSNTLITIGGQEVKKLAESPRKLVFESPKNLSGLTEILLRERNVEAKGEYRNVGVRLSAPKTNLTRGERTTLTIQVNGLQGIDKPMPLTLESHGVITMEGGSFQPLMIQPSQVTADGRYTTTRGVTGLQTGAWEATATVVTQPFNIILRDPDPPQTLLFNSFTGDYIFRTGAGKFSGAAQVKRQDCMAQVNSNQKDHELRGTINVCVPVDTGRFWFLHAAGTTVDIKITVTDTQPPRRKIYINPLGKPAPPIQDTSAFATCP